MAPRKKSSTPWYRAGRGWYTTVNGKQIPLGVSDPGDERAAIAALETLLKSLKTKRPGGAAPAWAASVAAFLSAKATQVKPRPVKPRTVTDYRNCLAVFLALHGTDAALDADRVERAIVGHKPGWSDNTRRNYLAAVELFLRWAGTPLTLSKPGRESAGAGMVITAQTYHMALGAARGELRPLLEFLWHTGARPSEAYSLTAEVVDWSSGTVTLREHKTRRHGKARTIYLSPAALAVLEGQRAKHPEGLLFPNRRGTRWRERPLAQAMWRLSARIGHRVTVYGFRHSFCNRALAMGISEPQVAALMGHSSTKMIAMHYGHLGSDARLLRDVAARIEAGPIPRAG